MDHRPGWRRATRHISCAGAGPFDPDIDQADLDGDGFGDACDPGINGDDVDDCPTLSDAGQGDQDGDLKYDAWTST